MCFNKANARSTCLCSELWPVKASRFPAGSGTEKHSRLPQTSGASGATQGEGAAQVLSCRNSGRPFTAPPAAGSLEGRGPGAHPNSQPDGLLQARLFQRRWAGCVCHHPLPSAQAGPASPWLMALSLIYTNANVSSTLSNTAGPRLGFSGTLCVESVTRLQCQGCLGGQLPQHLPTPSPLFSSSKHIHEHKVLGVHPCCSSVTISFLFKVE